MIYSISSPRFLLLFPITMSNSPGGVAQWTECWPKNQKVASSIPSQGTCLGCGPDPQLGECERQPLVSLPVFLPPLPSPLISKIFLKSLTLQGTEENRNVNIQGELTRDAPCVAVTPPQSLSAGNCGAKPLEDSLHCLQTRGRGRECRNPEEVLSFPGELPLETGKE